MMALPSMPPSVMLSDLLAGFAAQPLAHDARIERLTLDSREAGPGALFLACRGRRCHGLDYAAEAAARGCAAIAAEPDGHRAEADFGHLSTELGLPIVPVADLARRCGDIAARFFGDPTASLTVVGVTGTNGKTSVSHYLAQALADDPCCGIIGTLGSGFPGELMPGGLTTPDPVGLQATFTSLAARGASAVAMEVSSHALDQGRVGAVRFSHAVFTNLSRDHLDYHADMAAYKAAKKRLFGMPGLRWAVLNHDDPTGREIAAELGAGIHPAWYSLQPSADPSGAEVWVRAETIEPLPRGLRIEIASSAGRGELVVDLIGRFNAANALAVLAVLLTLGKGLDQGLRALAGIRGVPGRMECFGGGDGPLVVVDYAHTPDALEQALTNLRQHCGGSLITVFGCGGERDRGKRPLMGAIAERLSDQVIVTDDNPRGEDGEAICAAIRAGMQRPGQAFMERQRAVAIRRAIALAGRGDAVLVAGKGHETVQDMGELKVHFSDRAQVVQALGEWRGTGA